MDIEELIHKHFNPMEYSLGLKIFEEIFPDKKDELDRTIRRYYASKIIDIKDVRLWEFNEKLQEYASDIGNTLFSIYNNIYIIAKKDFEERKLTKAI
jgi:hypothetical protein